MPGKSDRGRLRRNCIRSWMSGWGDDGLLLASLIFDSNWFMCETFLIIHSTITCDSAVACRQHVPVLVFPLWRWSCQCCRIDEYFHFCVKFIICWHCCGYCFNYSNKCAVGSLKSFSEPFCWASFWWDSKWRARWNSAEALSVASVVQSAACKCHAWTTGVCYCYLSVRWMDVMSVQC